MPLGDYSISITAGEGVTIEWPKVLQHDDALVAFIQELRKCGVATSSKIDNTTGEMVVITPGTKGIYQRGMYIDPMTMAQVAEQWVTNGDAYVQVPQAKPGWIFQREIKTTLSHYGVLYQQQLYDPTPFPAGPSRSYADLSEELAQYIPDIRKRVILPCSCRKVKKDHAAIWDVIQHLNDEHHPKKKGGVLKVKGLVSSRDIWTRERIADWLDEVDADLAFDPDLPAKRAAARKAVQEGQVLKTLELAKQGFISTSAAMASLQAPSQQAMAGMVKLSTAIEEFELVGTIDLTWDPNDTFPGCKCTMCTEKNNQEES